MIFCDNASLASGSHDSTSKSAFLEYISPSSLNKMKTPKKIKLVIYLFFLIWAATLIVTSVNLQMNVNRHHNLLKGFSLIRSMFDRIAYVS